MVMMLMEQLPRDSSINILRHGPGCACPCVLKAASLSLHVSVQTESRGGPECNWTPDTTAQTVPSLLCGSRTGEAALFQGGTLEKHRTQGADVLNNPNSSESE